MRYRTVGDMSCTGAVDSDALTVADVVLEAVSYTHLDVYKRQTKARARSAVEELERRIPDLDAPVTIHVNGCPNSCARFQVADIGLKGLVMTCLLYTSRCV